MTSLDKERPTERSFPLVPFPSSIVPMSPAFVGGRGGLSTEAQANESLAILPESRIRAIRRGVAPLAVAQSQFRHIFLCLILAVHVLACVVSVPAMHVLACAD